jgi:8-oxo-dGTP pyrophosphatase MutT (NUDIX family)
MTANQPHILTADEKRRFACSPVAVVVFIVNEREEILLLAHPKRDGGWEVINGGLEAGETILEGALRETREEAGAGIQVRPLGTVHAWTFHYDKEVEHMISLGFLMAYEGGAVEPGDDMAGSAYRWWRVEELEDPDVRLIVPPGQKWLVRRAVELYRLWKAQDVELQPELSPAPAIKAK